MQVLTRIGLNIAKSVDVVESCIIHGNGLP
jgi:hypothetical protein